jgi:phenylalanyl-tRNA synthetase alpha subunit
MPGSCKASGSRLSGNSFLSDLVMTSIDNDPEPRHQVEAARKAFEQEFERFARFTGDSVQFDALDLEHAIAEQRSLAEVRTRHLGKKSQLAAAKKLIGRVPADQRAEFGQVVQLNEAEVTATIDQVEQHLKNFIENAKTARESVDITLPGRRPRYGHRHPITLVRMQLKTTAKSKPTSITSMLLISPTIIQREPLRILSTRVTDLHCALKHQLFRSMPCSVVEFRFG